MKILITSDLYKPLVNGVVTSVVNLKEGLERDGHEVRILTLSGTHHSMKVGNVYYLGSIDAGRIYPNIRILSSIGKSIIDELVEWNPDVIHTQCEFSTFVPAKIISKRTGAPIVHTYHTVYEQYTEYVLPGKRLGRRLAKQFTKSFTDHTNAVIVPTDKMEDMLSSYKVDTPMYVVPTGINLDRFETSDAYIRRTIRNKFGIGEDECLLTFVGRVAKEKNLEEIISFMDDARTNNIRLLVVGDGPDREDVEKEVARRGLKDRVIFAGMVAPSEVADYYKAGDIFVSASTTETQGLTYMEAMASGLVLLCRNDEALDDVVVNGENGFVYDNKEDFMNALFILMTDSEKRAEIAAKARASVLERYSIDKFAKDCERVYSLYAA